MAGTSNAPARRLLPREERQAQLLDAAATAFARGGFAATSMDDVAAQAGVTKLIVYRHFASKEELYRAVLGGVAVRLAEEYERELARPDDQSVGFATRAMLTVARAVPDGFRLLTKHVVREPQFLDLAQDFYQGSLDFTSELIGDRIPDPVIKAWAGPVIVDYLIQAVVTWLEVGSPDRDDELIDLATRGLQGMFVQWADPSRLGERPRRGAGC